MLKNKLLYSAVVFFMCSLPTLALENLSDVEFPKDPAYRVGISELPEKQYIQAQQEKVKKTEKTAKNEDIRIQNYADLTYADLSIKRLSKEIAQDLEYEEQDMLADLSLLWQGAAVQSDTINFALYKLANPDADKPDEKSIKNVLKTIASMSTLVGASMGSPLIAGSSLIGGNIFGIMSQDTKALNYKYTRVNDADMIILIRKVEDLQQKAVDLYYDYMSAKKQLDFANQLVEDRKYKFELAQKNNASRELVVITDAYYRTAMDKQRNAKSEFFSKRAALEQFVGNETFMQFEAELLARERGETSKTQIQSNDQAPASEQVQNEEYDKTVEAVKSYTSNLETQDNSSSVQEEIPEIRAEKNIVEEEIKEEQEVEVTSKKLAKFKFWERKTKPVGEKYIPNDVMEQTVNEPIVNSNSNISASKEEYINAVSELEKSLEEPKYDVYDFSDSYSGVKYFGDPMYEGTTGLAANFEEPVTKKSFFSRFKKGDDEKKEKVEKPKKVKVDPKSTKNLIFLHGESKETAKSKFNFNINGMPVDTGTKVQHKIFGFKNYDSDNIEQSSQQVKQTPIDKFDLPPLDEIKAPDLTRDGYSIHSEYIY